MPWISLTLAAPGKAPAQIKIKFFSLGNRPNSRVMRLFFSQIRASKAILRVRAQIWHIHDPELLAIAAILILLKRKVIWDAHEDYYFQFKFYSFFRTYIPPILQKVLSVVILTLLKYVDYNAMGVIAATEAIRITYSNTNCIVVGNEARPEEFENARPCFANNKVLFIGSATDAHCFQETVEAVASLEKLELIITDSAINPDVVKKSKQLLGDRISFVGRANRFELLNLISDSVVGMVTYQNLPTYNESEPTKLFEFLMSGLPIVATPIKPNRQYLELSGGGIVSKGFEAANLKQALEEILASEVEWSKMSKQGRAWARENATWSKSEAKLISFYSRLVFSGDT